ncbi:hypothetical protein NDU88_000823 [Pleurodeles waltl]|uniref:Myb-like domain-containing protein n=1 Tax=Pleurodeles waltl TaxID=8319 RepID=A0AAV7TGW8_PLEWA|nr:hypothetical protein NDU88_000823 [Pleurodeles waltl]
MTAAQHRIGYHWALWVPGANGDVCRGCRAHQKKGIWRAIAKEVRNLGVFDRRSTHCRKGWEDLHHWARKTAEAQLGLASERGMGARHTLTPLMFRVLVVAYPELERRLKASQQPQGASSGGGAEAPVTEGTASHMGLEAESTDGEGTSGTEGEGSTTTETGGDSTDSGTSSEASSLAVADTSVQYSPWPPSPAFVFLIYEKVHQQMCSSGSMALWFFLECREVSRFPSEFMLLMVLVPPRKSWRIGVL